MHRVHENSKNAISVNIINKTRLKWDMFCTSFLPLWIAVIMSDMISIASVYKEKWVDGNGMLWNIKSFMPDNIVSICTILFIIIIVTASTVSIVILLNSERGSTNLMPIKILKARNGGKLTSEYLIAYILPMIAFDFDSIKGIILFAIYFLILAFLCIKNGNVYVNVLFEIMKYKMYICDIEKEDAGEANCYNDCLVISKKNSFKDIKDGVLCFDLDKFVYIDLE